MKFKKLGLWIFSGAYLFILCILWASPYWPPNFYWLATLFQMSPLWVLIFPVCAILMMALSIRSKGALFIGFVSLIIIIFFIMGFNITLPSLSHKDTISKNHLRIISCNLGPHVDMRALSKFISNAKPDIIAFQEAYEGNQEVIKSILERERWDLSFQSYLGIASRLKIRNFEIINRDIVGGWGDLAVRYDLDANNGSIHFINVHFDTSRNGIEAVMDTGIGGLSEIKRVAKLQDTESDILSRWVMPYKNVLIAGDFNMQGTNPIYRDHWSGFINAFSKAGFGFGHTKFTHWHGVRIDHLLCDSSWKVMHSEVGPDIGSDHRPMLADVEFIGSESGIGNNGAADLASKVEAADKFIDILRVVIPKKAVRGNSFELVIHVKKLMKFYGGCNLVVTIGAEGEKGRFTLGSYPTNVLGLISEGQDVQIGPLPIILPEGIPIGRYVVEVRFEGNAMRDNVISNAPYPKADIEIVKTYRPETGDLI